MFTKLYTHKVTGETNIPVWGWQWKATYAPTPEQLASFQKEYKDTDKIGVFPVDEVYQFNKETLEMTPFSDVDQSRVRFFTLFNTKDPSKQINLVMQPGMKVIVKRRTLGVGYLGGKEVFIYILGYKHGNHYHHTYALPNGSTLMSDEDNIDLPDLFLYKNFVSLRK